MGFWREWQVARDRRRSVAKYLGQVLREPDEAQVRWLASLPIDPTAAMRELRYARRAVGLIVADRDALDDRTAAEVAHLLAPVIATESRQSPESGRVWSERWRAYTTALAVRGSAEPPAARLARVLLDGVGVSSPSPAVLHQATEIIQEHRAALNEALRAAFGDAALPEDVPPSALRV